MNEVRTGNTEKHGARSIGECDGETDIELGECRSGGDIIERPRGR